MADIGLYKGGHKREGWEGTFKHGSQFQSFTNEIDRSGNILIGNYVSIGRDVKIFTHKHDWGHSRGLRKDIEKKYRVNLVIEDDVFIGDSAIILPIGKIGKGAIIGAGAVVTKEVPAYEIWAGNPARKVGERG